ncbi:MAG: DUF3501 family protein [Deltaproteobacteria bacterium]|nr:MAG: DUF3501 family protein [Deltaproteobacteria bacterium]
MRPLALDDILDPDAYEPVRDAFRAAVIAHKKHRRLEVGECVTLVFEDRETLRFQVQEMVRIERIRERAAVQRELDVYNELVPGERELSATLFIEITDSEAIRPELDRLIGIDEHVALVLDTPGGEESVAASFDPKQMDDDRISAVHYIRFRLSPAHVERLRDPGVRARIRISHPNYRRDAEVAGPLRASLARDFEGDTPPLLPPDALRAG